MIRLIAACDKHLGIAKNGVMPWNIAEDLSYFKQMTKTRGGRVLVGRTTYQTFNHALEGRQTYVLSHQTLLNLPENVHSITDLDSFLNTDDDIWVMGGSKIYELTIGYAKELYITSIEADFSCDQFFPDFTTNFELLKSDGPHKAGDISYSFNVYERRI